MSNQGNGESQVALAILDAELKRIRDAAWEAWRYYFTFFTWFYGTQILVLGWIMTRKQEFPSGVNVIMLACTAIILNIASIYTTLRFRSFCALEAKRADFICRIMTDRVGVVGLKINITSGFPSDLVRSAANAGAMAYATAVVVWLYVIYYIAATG